MREIREAVLAALLAALCILCLKLSFRLSGDEMSPDAIRTFKAACAGMDVDVTATLTTGTWGSTLSMDCTGSYSEYGPVELETSL